MTSQRFLFQELNRSEIGQRARNGAIAVLPTGATEQHGPHLPTGTDAYAVEYVVREATELLADRVPLVVCPTLPYGCSPHHLPFGGTMSVSARTYHLVLWELMESLIQDGFQRALIINGHGGNHELVQLVVRDLALEHPVILGASSYWSVAGNRLMEVSQAPEGRTPGHAGQFETALIMAMRPDLITEPRPERDEDPSIVDPLELNARLRIERFDFYQRFDGYTDSPASASTALGQQYLTAAVSGVAEAIEQFHLATV